MTSIWLDAIDKKRYAGVLSFDLSSAFDCIDCNILCSKLHLYGFDATSINWVRSYLTNRSQFVQFESNTSSIETIVIGAPQGSVLSPIFFIILLADISEWTEFAILEGFADDMSITVTDDTIPNTIIQLEQDAMHILQFMLMKARLL